MNNVKYVVVNISRALVESSHKSLDLAKKAYFKQPFGRTVVRTTSIVTKGSWFPLSHVPNSDRYSHDELLS